MIPSQYLLFVAIGGLVFVLLLVVSIGQKYQSYQLQKEMTLRHMLRGVTQIEAFLDKLRGAAIPAPLMVQLRKEALARYVAMRQIHKKIKDIDQDIASAQRNLSAAEAAGQPARQPVSDRVMLDRFVAGIAEMMKFLREQKRITGISPQQKLDYLQQLADLRAEYLEEFHNREAVGLAKQEMWSEAMQHMKELMSMLQLSNPSTPRINQLFHQANLGYKQVSMKQVPGEVSSPST